MKHIKIAAGLAHVNYGRIADLVKEVSDAGADYIHSDAADMHDLQNMKLMGRSSDHCRHPPGDGQADRSVTSTPSAWMRCSSSRSTKPVPTC